MRKYIFSNNLIYYSYIIETVIRESTDKNLIILLFATFAYDILDLEKYRYREVELRNEDSTADIGDTVDYIIMFHKHNILTESDY